MSGFLDNSRKLCHTAIEMSWVEEENKRLQEVCKRQEQDRIDRQNAPFLKEMEQQTKALQEQVELLKKDVELAQQREADAKKEARNAKITAWVSIAIAIVSIAVSAVLHFVK